MTLLDTDILIDIQRGVPQAFHWFRMLPEIPAIPGLVAMKIIQCAQNRVQEENSLRFLRPFQSNSYRPGNPPAHLQSETFRVCGRPVNCPALCEMRLVQR